MEVRDLKALVSIAESGTLSGAASKHNLTQPALSALVRRLEGELEVKILTRHSRGVVFTEAGKFLLEKAHRILHEVAETTSSLRDIAEEPLGPVRIGLPTSLAAGVIPPLVSVVNRQYAGIDLHVVEAMSGSLVEGLQLGRLDLAVLFDVQPMPGLRSEPVLTEEVLLFVRSGDPLAQRPSASLEEIAAHRLVLPSADHSIRQFVERVARAEGVRLSVNADVDSYPGLIGLVREGYATILPPYLAMNDVRSGAIEAVRIRQPDMRWTLHLATRQDSVRPRAAMVVGRLLIDTFVSLVRSGAMPARIHPRHLL